MAELKLRQLHRGYVFTDFDGNEIGCKDSAQAMEEIEKLLKPDKKSEKPDKEESVEGHIRKPRQGTVELHRKIFEKAREQVDLTGKVNAAQIARELEVNASNVSVHLKKMNSEIELLIKKWQDERDKKMVNVDTKTSLDGGKLPT